MNVFKASRENLVKNRSKNKIAHKNLFRNIRLACQGLSCSIHERSPKKR